MFIFLKLKGDLARKFRAYCDGDDGRGSARRPQDIQPVDPTRWLEGMIERSLAHMEAPAAKPIEGIPGIVATYRRMRDQCAEINRLADAEVEAIKAQMKKLNAVLLATLNANKVNSMQSDEGTFYKEKKTYPRCNDWDVFYSWMMEDIGRMGALERRVTKTFITDYVEQHGELPPGISETSEYEVGVRKPTK